MRLLKYILPLCLAIALVFALLANTNITFPQFYTLLGAISTTSALGIFCCTGAFVLLSSLKWGMVMRGIAGAGAESGGWAVYVFYTSLGSVLSTVMTVHLGVAVTRALGAKFHLKQSQTVGAGASIYEQLFDVGVILLFVVPAVLVLVFGLDPWVWVLLALCSVILTGVTISLAARPSRRLLLGLVAFLGKYSQKFKAAADFLTGENSRFLFRPGFMIQMFLISVVRYLILMLRSFLVLWATGIQIADQDFLNAFSLVQMSKFVSVTPAGLGISEWTWSGVLALFGYPLDTAVQFVLVHRVATVLSLVAFCAVVSFAGLALWGRTRVRKYGTGDNL